ncbi:MAG: hypoxanthine phosphoribosyltransferase [Planctomycetes bacterium]|nr:hypoxanthine phosphoribosyltransferase [Planctomycetota bacterium]
MSGTLELRRLYDRKAIAARVRRLGREIAAGYRDLNPMLVGVLNGAGVFTADLARELRSGRRLVPAGIEFIKVRSYDGTRSTGKHEMELDVPAAKIRGRHVILVEDIVDTGETVRYLMAHLKAKAPASLVVCALLDKRGQRKPDLRGLEIRYVGFEVPDVFVVGYGIDCDGAYRNLPEICGLVGA